MDEQETQLTIFENLSGLDVSEKVEPGRVQVDIQRQDTGRVQVDYVIYRYWTRPSCRYTDTGRVQVDIHTLDASRFDMQILWTRPG